MGKTRLGATVSEAVMRGRRELRAQRGFVLFLLCFGLMRTAVADWNPVPSGSMRPSILEGDVVLVNRLAYDLKLPLSEISLAQLGEPQRGDIVVFHSPRDGTRLIKRVVGLPGDVLEVEAGRQMLYVNGRAASYGDDEALQEELAPGWRVAASRVTETVGGHSWRVQRLDGPTAARLSPQTLHFGPQRVPEGHYFMMGDNRDNSADSRVFGPVPRRLLVGRAHRVLVSVDIIGHWAPRWNRWGSVLP